jgi:hypothetical protein
VTSLQTLDGRTLLADVVRAVRSSIITFFDRERRTVVKLPLIYHDLVASSDQRMTNEILSEDNRKFYPNERAVLQKLGHHPGIMGWGPV